MATTNKNPGWLNRVKMKLGFDPRTLNHGDAMPKPQKPQPDGFVHEIPPDCIVGARFAARYIGWKYSTLEAYIRRGKITPMRTPKNFMVFRRSELDAIRANS